MASLTWGRAVGGAAAPLAGFDHTMRPAPSIPLLSTKREHRDFGLVKKLGLAAVYWNSLLEGLA